MIIKKVIAAILLFTSTSSFASRCEDAEPLISAIFQKNSAEIVRLINDPSTNVDALDCQGLATIHLAAAMNNHEAVKLLVEKKANMNVHAREYEGRTPLIWATESNALESVKILVDAKANIEAQDNRGNTALLQSLLGSAPKLEIAKILVENGADASVSSSQGLNFPFYLAADHNAIDLVELMVSKGARINQKNKYGTTSLHLACYEGHYMLVKKLLELKANPDLSDGWGRTPLMTAATHQTWGSDEFRLKAVQFLLAAKAEVNARDQDSLTALKHALNSGFTEAANLIRAAGGTE